MIPEATTLPCPRFFWPGLLVALPLLVLAALAAAGLRSRWQARLGEAQEEARKSVERIREAAEDTLLRSVTWTSLAIPIGTKMPPEGDVGWYPLVPQPPEKVSEAWTQALESGDPEQFRTVRNSSQEEWTDAGLPAQPLAAWELFHRESNEENARRLVGAAVYGNPSVVSPVILARGLEELDKTNSSALTGILKEGIAAWEARQEILRMVREQELLLRLRENQDQWLLEKGQLWKLRLLTTPGKKVFTAIPMRQRLFDQVRGELQQLPPWVKVSFRFKGELLRESPGEPSAPPDDGSTERSGLIPEKIAGPITVHTDLVNTDQLYAPLRTEAWWAGGLIAAATAAAGGGLWLSHRALRREERLHALKSQFVASVSHELRAPIGSVRLMAEALDAGTVSGEAAKGFYRLLAQEGQRLSALIENVLDFARMESGRKAYQFEETDIAALLRDTRALLEPRAAPRGIRIQLDLQILPRVPEVDALAVQQAVMNLLDNALKFSPDHGIITVTLAEGSAAAAAPAADFPGGGWSISIADEGPGIPPAEHRRIFERFHRLGNELRRETQGAGIGLSLVKHIAEGHGGRVTVENREPRGSVFTLRIPFRKVDG
ncbi:MAG: HAMP domain-containing sensor histidine kinase [Verrucomicrobiota bacterium]